MCCHFVGSVVLYSCECQVSWSVCASVSVPVFVFVGVFVFACSCSCECVSGFLATTNRCVWTFGDDEHWCSSEMRWCQVWGEIWCAWLVVVPAQACACHLE